MFVSSLLARGCDHAGATNAHKADANRDKCNEDPVDDEHDLHDIASIFSIVLSIFHVGRANLASGIPSPDCADDDKDELGNRGEARVETEARDSSASVGKGKAHACTTDTEQAEDCV